MLTCKDVSELSDDWLEGTLPFKKKASVKLHLAMCKHCRRYLNYMKLTVAAVGDLETSKKSDLSASADRVDAIMVRIEEEASKQP